MTRTGFLCGCCLVLAACGGDARQSGGAAGQVPAGAGPDLQEVGAEARDAVQAPQPPDADELPDPVDAAAGLDARAPSSRADASGLPGEDAGASRGGDAGASAAQRRGLRGAFVLVTNDRPASFYRAAVREMAELRMEHVIVQTESYLRSPNFARNAVARELLDAVLEQARVSGMQVHLGLVLPEWGNGDVGVASDGAFIDAVVEASTRSFDGLMVDYGEQPAWTGVYLPLELWTPGSADGLGQLPRYLEQVAAHVKQRGTFVISISPFISALADRDGAATEAAYDAIFRTAAIDIVALQDGVGARGLSVPQLANNLPYYRAMLRACTGRCEVWANVESFGDDGPAEWERFSAQMETLAELVPQQVTYEYTHYLMSGGAGGSRAAALHADYAAWLAAP